MKSKIDLYVHEIDYQKSFRTVRNALISLSIGVIFLGWHTYDLSKRIQALEEKNESVE